MKDIQKINVAHTINSIALSMIGVYVPAYLLTLGFPLSRVILFYIINHGFGVIVAFFAVVPLIQKWGLINTFKIYYPLKIILLLLLITLPSNHIPPEVIAMVSGAATFFYWIPVNILFIRFATQKQMGSDISKFFALPKLFGIAGPLVAALLIPWVGFWPVFVLTILGLLVSFMPLAKIVDTGFTVKLNFTSAWQRIKRQKLLFAMEAVDNVIEESEWFWGIYVFLIIGSLATPGIVGSLESIGGVIFTLVVGKAANKKARGLIPVAVMGMLLVTISRFFVTQPVSAYVLTVIASFIMTLFLISYFSTIYKTIKGDDEEEFIILREIPTVFGRMIVFAAILLTVNEPRLFFITPFIFTILLLAVYLYKKDRLVE